jgi:hypothetical protein
MIIIIITGGSISVGNSMMTTRVVTTIVAVDDGERARGAGPAAGRVSY